MSAKSWDVRVIPAECRDYLHFFFAFFCIYLHFLLNNLNGQVIK